MLWNHALHLIGGVLGANIMTWSAPGVLTSVAFSSFVQGISMIFLHFDVRNRFSVTSEDVQKNSRQMGSPPGSPRYWYKFAQTYVVKVIWYGLVTLLAAHVMRILSA